MKRAIQGGLIVCIYGDGEKIVSGSAAVVEDIIHHDITTAFHSKKLLPAQFMARLRPARAYDNPEAWLLASLLLAVPARHAKPPTH